MIRIHPLVLLSLGLIACGRSPWAAPDAPKVPPDEQFRTGVEVGYDAWVWHCYAGKRVVITQSGSACFGTSAPRRSSGPCGAPLDAEQRFPKEGDRHDVPDGYRWPGSAPAAPRTADAAIADAGTTAAPDADADATPSLVHAPPPTTPLERVDNVTAYASLELLCADFLRQSREEGAEIAKTFSFHQVTPRCRPGRVPSAFAPSPVFLEARTVDVARVSREESRLALKLARGWVLTPAAWDIRESESATPPWGVQAPERVTTTGSDLVVYLGGEERAPAKGYRALLGAHACRDQPPTLTCWRWDPTEQVPLGTKEAASAALAKTYPWTNPHTLTFSAAGIPTASALP